MKNVLADIKEMRIQTERIRLRPFVEEDFLNFFEYIIQKEQQRLSGNPRISTEVS